MDQEMEERIKDIEELCRYDIELGHEVTYLDNQEILDIFAAFRNELTKATKCAN